MGKSSPDLSVQDGPGTRPLGRSVYRYFFFGWLFEDANAGSGKERALALQHNREMARWLPTYMLRWLVVGAVTSAVQLICERWLAIPVLSAALTIAFCFAAYVLMMTVVFWAFLARGNGRDG